MLGRPRVAGGHRETDRLAATLARYWAGHADPASPLGRFAETGAISDATVDALYEDLVALERAAEPKAWSCATRARRRSSCSMRSVTRTSLLLQQTLIAGPFLEPSDSEWEPVVVRHEIVGESAHQRHGQEVLPYRLAQQ